MLGVAVGGIGRHQDIGLLGARGHPRGGPRTLYVDQHGGYLGEIGQTEKLAHQGHPGTAGCGERPGTVPIGTDHHTQGRQLVLRLDNRVIFLAGARVNTQPTTIFIEGINHRR